MYNMMILRLLKFNSNLAVFDLEIRTIIIICDIDIM